MPSLCYGHVAHYHKLFMCKKDALAVCCDVTVSSCMSITPGTQKLMSYKTRYLGPSFMDEFNENCYF